MNYTVPNMDKIANILLYVGTILVGFQIVGKIGYVSAILTLPFALPIKPLMEKYFQSQKGKRKSTVFVVQSGYFFLFIIVAFVFISIGILMLPIWIVYFFIGQPLLTINRILNKLYQKSMEPWKDIFFSELYLMLAYRKVKTKIREDEVWKKTKQNEIPFLALFGLVSLTVGFILQLI
jgi:hypothetical protein